MDGRRVLVVIDGSDGSRRTVDYVARLVGGQPGWQLHLLELLPPLPPKLLEFGGKEKPAEEAQAEARLRAEQRGWVDAARRATRPELEAARAELERAGVPAGAVRTGYLEVADGADLAAEVVRCAAEAGCGSLAIARGMAETSAAIVASDLADAIVRQAAGVTVWMVE
jgi:nucleotide-binding universal stress UspA family protein